MRRYLSLSKRNSTMVPPVSEKGHDRASTGLSEDNASTAALMPPSTPLAPVNLKVKRVDHYYSWWSRSWKYKNMGEHVKPEKLPAGVTSSTNDNDPWKSFCFVVIRSLPKKEDEGEPSFKVVIKSSYLLKACKDVMQKIPGISWNVDSLQLAPELLITFLPNFEEYHANLANKRPPTQEEENIMATVGVLIEYLHRDYKSTLASIANLTAHGEITFDLLYAILVPRTILVATCPTTGEPRGLRLLSATKTMTVFGGIYELICESIDAVDNDRVDGNSEVSEEGEALPAGRSWGRVQHKICIFSFDGTEKIDALDAYPIKYHSDEDELKDALIARGKKWVSLKGVHHMQYKGTSAFNSSRAKNVKYNVSSRIMIDRANFRRLHPNYDFPVVKQDDPTPKYLPEYAPSFNNDSNPNANIRTLQVQKRNKRTVVQPQADLTEEELMLTSPVVYGFSLSDKLWLEFNVALVTPIVWNDEAFENLVLPPGRKTLLKSLVEAHNSDLGFDDFVKGKGHGLVINLFGPPGVGKTLSAEATSEHVRRPLYVVGSGDLGTSAKDLDEGLQEIFDIATGWKAIVLIDEADVFLEERSLHDLKRNAMIAVFLRHVEYYRGILFLTTNRIKSYDEAFLSRIHVALHFQELSKDARAQVWRAFLQKVGVEVGQLDSSFDEDQLDKLADRNINGRQIKNATRTANSLAVSRGEPLAYGHLMETLDAMDEFTNEFKALSKQE